MRRKDLLPWYLRNLPTVIRGFEDKDDEDDKSKESEDDGDDDDEGGDDKDKGKSEDNDGLKSALQKERTERKRLERESKAMKKRLDDLDSKDKSDTDKAKDDASKAESKAQKLTAKLRETAVDNAIIKVGGKLKFRDIDDALKLIDRDLIVVDQDDDEPSEVEIDEATVKTALEKLAKAKPHLILAEGQEERSGSKFNGSRKTTKEADEEVLRKQYPALNRSIHTS